MHTSKRSSADDCELFPQQEAIRFFCGVCENDWNGTPVEPGAFACVSPVYGRTSQTKRCNAVALSENVKAVIQDSGAFCDGPGERLTFEAAHQRQLAHAARFQYADRVLYRASYDQLVLEKREREPCPQRGATWDACVATIEAARYLSEHRSDVPCILSAQGASAEQYLICVQHILPFLHPEDVLGLGGWCALGKSPAHLMPIFRQMVQHVLPLAGREGVKRIHLWGCLYAPALGLLHSLCDQYGIQLSTDSVGPTLRPIFGKWGYSFWTDPTYKYRRPPNGPELGRHRRLHCYLVRRWLRAFRTKEPHHYCNASI